MGDAPNYGKYGVPFYCAADVPPCVPQQQQEEEEPVEGENREKVKEEHADGSKGDRNYVVLAGGGGEGRSGIPIAILLAGFDFTANSLSPEPASTLISQAFLVGDSTKIRVLVQSNALRDPAAVVLGSSPGEGRKVSLIAAFTPGVVELGIQTGKFVGPIAKMCGGGGGGRPNFAQAGGRKPENLPSALKKAKSELVTVLSDKAA